jgi:hypothetical protein
MPSGGHVAPGAQTARDRRNNEGGATMVGRSAMRPRRIAAGAMVSLAALGLAALGVAWTPVRAQASPKAAPNGPPFPKPPDKITSALAKVPAEFAGVEEQVNFDLYSWLTFIALNWPADPKSCGPNPQESILSGKGPVVWETYLQDSDVFVAPGGSPSPWCPQSSPQALAQGMERLPQKVRELSESTGVRRFVHQDAKVSKRLAQRFPGIEQAVGGPLTDQNGRFARYEIRLNEDEYNYLIKNTLWSHNGQVGFKGPVSFPSGPSSYGPVGPIEIKAAWKVLGQGDDPGRFYTIEAIVYNDETGEPSPGPNPAKVGLVGFHISHKTLLQQDWIWSTFEQEDNLTRSFSNPSCPPAQCPPDVQTAKKPYTELNPNGSPINKPVQVTRVNPIPDPPTALNQHFQKILGNSPWSHYQLVSTQWVGEKGTLPKPPFLANTVQETYVQGPSPPSDGPIPYPQKGYNPFSKQASASCMKCHGVAQTTTNIPADFSFLLGEAQ